MKTNYFKVGIFVLVAAAAFVAGVVVIGAGYIGRSVVHFETYFDESVSGLTVGSAVEIRGVRVGEVTEIGFLREAYDLPADPNERGTSARYVRVAFAAYLRRGGESPTKYTERWLRRVDRGLRIRLSSNIITGQAILEGAYVDPNRYPPMKATWEPQYTYIPSVPSELRTLKDSIDSILTQLRELDVSGLVSTTKTLMVSLNKTVNEANIPVLSNEAQTLFAELRQTNKELQELLKGPPDLMGHNIPQAVVHLNEAIDRLNSMLLAERPQIDVVLSNLVEVSTDLKELTETLKSSPSELFHSTSPPRTEAFK